MINKLITFVLLLFTTQITAQSISGFVHNSENKPISQAYIIAEGTSLSAVTNDSGHFEIDAKKNSYLSISCLGFEDNRVKIEQNSLNVELKEKANFLNTVVVTGTRTNRTLKNTPVLTKVVSSNDLVSMGAITALDALENLMPGVHFTPNPMGDNIQIQGLNNGYILVLIDGERLAPERNENVNFSRLNVAEIERIEILNGASSVLYGSNAIGGVINIITKKIYKPIEGYMQGRYSKFNTYNADASVGFRIKELTSKTGFNFKKTDGYDLSPETPQSFTVNPNEDYTITQLLKYNFSKKLSAEANGRYYSHETENPPLSANTTHRLDRNYTVGGKVNYFTSDKNTITLTGHSDIYKGYKILEKKDNQKELTSDYLYNSFRLTDAFTLSEKIQIIGGAEYNYEKMFSENLFGNIPDDESSNNVNLFAQGDFKIIKDLQGVIGARYTDHSGFGSHFAPNMSLMFKLNNFRFRTSLSNGFKTPSLKEMFYNFDHQGMFYVIGNPNLKPEESWYKSVSAEYLNKDINVSATFFHNSITDKINTVQYSVDDENGNPRNEMRYENVADAGITGLDVFAQINFMKHFSFKGGYTFANAIDKSDDSQISGNSKHNITSALSFRYNDVRIGKKHYPFIISFSGRYSSPRIYYNETTDENGNNVIVRNDSPAYSIWRLMYTQYIPIKNNWNVEIQGGIDNIFNHVDNTTFINPGRTFSILFKISF